MVNDVILMVHKLSVIKTNLQVSLELQELLVHKVFRESRVFKVQLVPIELIELIERTVQLALKDLKVFREFRDYKVFKVPLVLIELIERTVQLVLKVLKVFSEFKDYKVFKVSQVMLSLHNLVPTYIMI